MIPRAHPIRPALLAQILANLFSPSEITQDRTTLISIVRHLHNERSNRVDVHDGWPGTALQEATWVRAV